MQLEVGVPLRIVNGVFFETEWFDLLLGTAKSNLPSRLPSSSANPLVA